ncbi:hypothetical protein D3C76_1058870 [compost metagenome]
MEFYCVDESLNNSIIQSYILELFEKGYAVYYSKEKSSKEISCSVISVPKYNNKDWISINDIPQQVLALFSQITKLPIINDKDTEEINNEVKEIEAGSTQVLTYTEAVLTLKGYNFSTVVYADVNENIYYVHECDGGSMSPEKWPSTSLFKPNIRVEVIKKGWNSGVHYYYTVYVPWIHTKWKNLETYNEQKENKEVHEEIITLSDGKKFARLCSDTGKRIGISFEVVLVFRNQIDEVMKFKQSLEKAIKDGCGRNKDIMHELKCEKMRHKGAIKYMKIYVGDVDTNRLHMYIHQCLKERRIITRNIN